MDLVSAYRGREIFLCLLMFCQNKTGVDGSPYHCRSPFVGQTGRIRFSLDTATDRMTAKCLMGVEPYRV
jgi:hypothetical protein